MTRLVVLFVAAAAVFGLCVVLQSLVPTAPPWLPQAVIKSALLVFSLAAISFDPRRTFVA